MRPNNGLVGADRASDAASQLNPVLGRPKGSYLMTIGVSDGLLLAFSLLVGLWWLCLPASVIRFYTWFHRNKGTLPRPGVLRLAGGVWCAVVILILWSRISR